MTDLNSVLNSDDILSLSALSVDQKQQDANGRTPLHRAVAASATDCALWLLDQSKEAVNVADNQGETPLMRASWLGNATVVEALLEGGADLHAKARTGGTALHHAHGGTAPSCQAVIERLVKAGANPAAVDVDGKSPAQWSAFGQAIAAGEAVRNPPKPRTLSIKRR